MMMIIIINIIITIIISQGVKRPGRGVDHPSLSSSEVKERSRAIPVLRLWTFTTCYGVYFTFTFMGLFTYSPEMPEEYQEYIRIGRCVGLGLDCHLCANVATRVSIWSNMSDRLSNLSISVRYFVTQYAGLRCNVRVKVPGVQLKSGPLTKPWIFHVRCYL